MTSAHRTFRWSETSDGTGRAVVRRCADNGPSAHDHDFMELAIVMSGNAVHASAFGESPLSSGSAVLLRPGFWHAYPRSTHLEVLNFCFPLSLARDHWRHMVSERVRAILQSKEGVRVAQLPMAAVDVLRQLDQVPRGSTGELGLMMWVLDQFASAAPAPTLYHPAVEQAIRRLDESSHRPWTADGLARTVGLDKAYLSRLFKAQVGVSPMAYLAITRAERAASLLQNSQLSCGEVGLSVGYADATIFARRFRAHFGLSPSAYRRRSRESGRS